MSKTKIAKKVAHMIVATNVAAVVETQLVERTDLEEDTITVNVLGFVAGNLVANQTDRITDVIIDKAISKYTTWKNRNNEEPPSE